MHCKVCDKVFGNDSSKLEILVARIILTVSCCNKIFFVEYHVQHPQIILFSHHV